MTGLFLSAVTQTAGTQTAGAVAFFCLGTGAALGCLWLLFQAVRILLRAGKPLTALLDILYCCLCGTAVFLCALAVDHGRLRLFQAALQLLGGWAAVAALGPFVSRAAGALQKIFRRVSGVFRSAGAFLGSRFHRRRPRKGKKAEKTGKKGKKQQKKT